MKIKSDKEFFEAFKSVELNANQTFEVISEAIAKMREAEAYGNLEILVNGNLASIKNKLTGEFTVCGCKIVPKFKMPDDLTFVVRKEQPKAQSNFDKIMASVEALAKFMSGFMPCGCCVNCDEAKNTTRFESLEKCQQGIAEWLKQEATDDMD